MDWELGFGIRIWNSGLEFGIEIGDWDWGFGLGIGIRDWALGLRIGVVEEDRRGGGGGGGSFQAEDWTKPLPRNERLEEELFGAGHGPSGINFDR